MLLPRLSLAMLAVALSFGVSLPAAELPPEAPLWEKPPQNYLGRSAVKEQLRSHKARADAPSGMNRVYSSVTAPTYSLHRPKKPNGVGVVICPGGGFKDVWIDREGHDLALWLKERGVTSLVLKYRTRLPGDEKTPNFWPNYQRTVRADGKQAIRILRKRASELGLRADKIGICGFSAGGHLAISCALYPEPKRPNPPISGMPNFAGLFYPGIPDDIGPVIERRADPKSQSAAICPMFVMNARVDKLTPVDKCLEFYAMLLKADVKAELHIFSKGSHGFDLGAGRGKSLELWPASFAAWLRDSNIIQDE